MDRSKYSGIEFELSEIEKILNDSGLCKQLVTIVAQSDNQGDPSILAFVEGGEIKELKAYFPQKFAICDDTLGLDYCG